MTQEQKRINAPQPTVLQQKLDEKLKTIKESQKILIPNQVDFYRTKWSWSVYEE